MQITTAHVTEPATRVLVPANTDTDPVQSVLEGYGGDDRAAIGALLDLVYRQHSELEHLQAALASANGATSLGYVRGAKQTL